MALTPKWVRAQTAEADIDRVRAAFQNLREHPADPEAVKALATMEIADQRVEGDLLVMIVREARTALLAGNQPWGSALEQVLQTRMVRPNVPDVLLSALADAPSDDVKEKIRLLYAIRLLLIGQNQAQRDLLFSQLQAARIGAYVRDDQAAIKMIETILEENKQQVVPLVPRSKYYEKFFPNTVVVPSVTRIELGPNNTSRVIPPTPPTDEDKEVEVAKAQIEVLRELAENADEAAIKELLNDPSGIQGLIKLSIYRDPENSRVVYVPPKNEDLVSLSLDVRQLSSDILKKIWALQPTLRGDCLAYEVKMGFIPLEKYAGDASLPASARRALARAAIIPRRLPPAPGSSSGEPTLTVQEVRVPRGPVPKTVQVKITLNPGSELVAGDEMTLSPIPGTTIVSVAAGSAALSAGKSLSENIDLWKVVVAGGTSVMQAGTELVVTLSIQSPSVSVASVNILQPLGTTPQGYPFDMVVDTSRGFPYRLPLVTYGLQITAKGMSAAEKEIGAQGLADAVAMYVADSSDRSRALPREFDSAMRSLGTPALEAAGQWAKAHALDPKVVSELDRMRDEASSLRDKILSTLHGALNAMQAGAQAALNACDINGDGVDNILDVTDIVNMDLGIVTPCTANITGPGVCNIATVQRVIDATLPGGTCNTGSAHWVSITWGASTGSNLVGYGIYRTNGDPDVDYNDFNNYTQLNTSMIVGLGYNDYNVINGKTYWYMAKAFNAYGQSSPPSLPSNAAPIPLASLQTPASKNVQNASSRPPRRRFWSLFSFAA
jgi:hypothetical protein